MVLVSVGSVLLGVAVVALSLFSVGMAQAPTSSAASQEPTDPKSKGSPRASVVVTEYFDYQCPACAVFALTIEPEIDRLYVDTGKVRFVSRNYAFLGPESFVAAEAAEAAAAQGRYFAYRSQILQGFRAQGRAAYRPEFLKRVAGQLGLNQATFDAALDRGTYRDRVLAEVREGDAAGVNSTPTIFINGRKVEGAVPTVERLSKLIDDELAAKP